MNQDGVMRHCLHTSITLVALAAGALAGWWPEERLTERPDSADRTGPNNGRAIASDPSGNLHVVWYGARGSEYQVWYSRWDAATLEWSRDTVISVEDTGAVLPAVAADDSDNAHVVWQVGVHGEALRYRRRDAVSGNWGRPETVAVGTHVERPSIAALDPDFVVAAWEQHWPGSDKNVLVAARDANGWQPAEQVSGGLVGGSIGVSVGVDGQGTIGVLWNSRSGGRGILFRRKTTSGWQEIDTLDSDRQCEAPCFWVEPSGTGHAVWTAGINPWVFHYYRQFRDGVWSDTSRLPKPANLPPEPASISARGGRVHGVFCADSGSNKGVYQITADSMGRNWSEPFRLAAAQRSREDPSLCCGPNDNVQLVWTDYRHTATSDPDAYCRRFELVRDIGVARVLQPRGEVEPDSVVEPTIWLQNFGREATAGARAWFVISHGYADTADVPSILPGDSALVRFEPWRADSLGWHAMSCSVGLAGDEWPPNNVIHDSFLVALRDVAAESILVPVDTTQAQTITPSARVRNLGSVFSDFECRFRVVSESLVLVYTDTVLASLRPDSAATVEFRPWRGPPGSYIATCSTALARDMRHENDKCSTGFMLHQPDVRFAGLLWPPVVVDSGSPPGRPAVRVRNSGVGSTRFSCQFSIGGHYFDTIEVDRLKPGCDSILRFSEWHALRRGLHEIRCSIIYPELMDLPAPSIVYSVFVRVADVSAESIIAPVGTVPLDTVWPSARLRNLGNERVCFSSRLRIAARPGGVVYDDTSSGTFEPSSSRVVVFPPWFGNPGYYSVTCSTLFSGDMRPENDAAFETCFVLLRDVTAESILTPVGGYGLDSIWPEAMVRNLGNVQAEFDCRFVIDSGQVAYADTVRVSLEPESSRVVRFRLWDQESGHYGVLCSTALADDLRPDNDTVCGSCFVGNPDVGIDAWLWPGLTVDSGVAGRPAFRVHNYGDIPVSFWCWLRIEPDYADTVFVRDLSVGVDTVIEFREWQAVIRGAHPLECSLYYRHFINQSHSSTVFVRVRDAGVEAILGPSGVVGVGEITPKARIANCGNVRDSVGCWFDIRADSDAGRLLRRLHPESGLVIPDSRPRPETGLPTRSRSGRFSDEGSIRPASVVYRDSLVLLVEPESDTVVEFRAWQTVPGSCVGRCSTGLWGDRRPENDTASSAFRVVRIDASAEDIESPCGRIPPGPVTPRVRIGNLGEEALDIMVCCAVADSLIVFGDTALVLGVLPMQETVAVFRNWEAVPGQYRAYARVIVLGDFNPSNDTVSGEVVVEPEPSQRWQMLASVPAGPRKRPVRDGGSLVAVDGGVVALKGCNSDECYRYHSECDSWTSLAALPTGESGRKARSGAALCWDGEDMVFALKGSHTREFWCYSISRDCWDSLPSLPAGSRSVKWGAGLCFVPGDTGKVYLAKGSGTVEFLVYWAGPKQWHALRPLPLGTRSRKAKHGTSLVWTGERMFCLKGATEEFYEYEIGRDTWRERADFPKAPGEGRAKRPGRGAALTSDGRFVYALKGNSTNEFWAHDIARDTWIQAEDVPDGRPRRRVNRGGALACSGGRLYALKGGGCCDFWCYDPGVQLMLGPIQEGVSLSGVSIPIDRALPGLVPVRGGLLLAGLDALTDVEVFDAAGRAVSVSLERGPDGLHLTGFRRNGVYFVSLGSGRTLRLTVVK